VTTTGSCTPANLSGSIIVTAGPVVSLTSAAGTNAQEICTNIAITNITYSVTGGSGTTVTGLPAGVTGSLSGTVFTISGTPTQSGTFNYTVSTTSSCGQSNANGTITINALPTADFNFSSPGCANRIISFTSTSIPNSGVITSYSWNFGDPSSGGNNTSNLQNPSHTFATAGSYTVTLNVTTDKGCTNSTPFTRTLTVNANPTADFTVPNICVIDAGVFTDISSVVAPNTITGYEWNFGDPASGASNTSTTQHGTHTFSAGGTYTVTHMVFSNAGCSDTIQRTITLSGNPFSDFGIQNPNALCANDSVSISNQATVTPGTITKVEIYWDNVGQPTVFDVDNSPTTGKIYRHLYPNFQTPLTRTFDIRYRAYSGGTCVKDTIKAITVNAAPKVQFNAIPDVCHDAAPFQITQATEIGGVPGNGVFSGPGVSASGLFTPSSVGPGTYSILFTYTSTAGGCVDTLSRTLRVLDSASARFTFNPLVCDKTAVDFNSSTSTPGAGTITSWSWNFGDPASGAANTSTLQNPSHLFSAWGTYNVTLSVTTSNGCRSTVRTIPVTVNPIPRAAFTFPPSACLPSANIQFTNASTIADGSQGSLSYLWNFGDPASGALNTSSGSNPSHIYNTAGPFSVNLQVTSAAGCVHDTTLVVNNIHPEPTGLFTASPVDVCVGQSITFTDNSNPADGTTVQWNWDLANGNTRNTPTFTYTYPSAGTYNVTLHIINSFGCKSTTHTQTVTVNAYPQVNAGPDLYILEGGSDTLQPIVTATNPTFLWTPNQYFVSSNTIQNAIVNGVADITYTLTVTGRGGCTATDQVKVFVLKGPEIPNIFSPNGDGIHDTWQIKYLDTYPGGTVEVFNRYGQRLFRSVGYSTPWDGTVNGKPVPMGTYYYIVDPKNGRTKMSGYVDVIR
jgi:gliding motility-associated-like protein